MRRSAISGFVKLLCLLPVLLATTWLSAQGNKLSIQGKGPKNLSICGYDDTANITVYNISASVITGIKVTLTLPAGINYIKGTVTGGGASESNVSNLNKPVFSAPNLLLGQNFTFRIKLTANCDLLPLLSGSYTPDIGIRVDYTGNYDVGTSSPFVPVVPSPGFASITNISYTANVGDVFIRKTSITNYGKGPLTGIRFTRINGSDLKDAPQKGFTNVSSGDTVRTFFNTADIKKIGDGDTLFEQNETLIITDTITIKGCNKISTYFEIGWGCGGKICQIIKSNGAVTISSDNPVLKVWTSSVNKLCFDGTTPNTQYLTVTNTGKKDAKKPEFYIYIPYGASNCRFDTATIRAKTGYKGKSFRIYPDSCYMMYYVASCMPNFSVTYMKLNLPDISPKDTIYISWDMYRCAGTSCGFAFYDMGWMFNHQYRNQCNSLTAVGGQWGLYYGANWGSVSSWVPSDIAKDETKDFRFTFTTFANVQLDATAKIRIDFVLPKSLTHSLNKSDFFIVNGNQTATWYPDSIAWRKDTLRAFMGKTFPFSLVNAELTVRLKGICSVYSGNASLPVSMALYYNPMPACNPYIWINPVCASFNVKVHCSSTCSGGMQFRNFEVYRSSYGLPDNDNDGKPDASGSLDFSKIRRERAMFGDTITSVFMGRPKATASINNWRYGYAESFVTYGAYIDVLDARLVIIKGSSTVYTGNCNTVRVKKITSGAHATFKFDFSVDSIYPKGCLSSSFRFTANDSVRLIVRYKVTKNLSAQGLLSTFSNRFYFGSVANPGTGQWYQCDTFSGNMMLYGYYLYNCCGDNVVYSNCADVALSQSWFTALGAWSYAGNNLFLYEYRPWTKMKALRVYLPNGFKLKNTWYGQYRTSGTGAYTLEQSNNLTPVSGSTYPLVFDFTKTYKDSGGTILNSDDGVQGYFTYTVQPRCNLPANTPIKIDYDYIFERRGIWGKGYDTISTKVYGGADYFTFVPPTLKLTPQVPTVYATKDTVDWIVSYSNPSATFSAYNVWLSPRSTSNIKVVEVRDADKDTLIKTGTDLYKAGVLASGQLRRFKIRAVYNSCAPDSLVVYGSYDCADYPSDFASYPCKPTRTTLFLEPQNTRLQVTLTDSATQTDLCATNKMTLQVENIQAVTVYNTKVRISLPIGMTVVNNSASLRYPLSASAQSIGQPALISGTIYEWDLSSISTPISKGFVGTTDTSKNKLLITFRVKTDCDYASGSFLSARVLSNIRCGDAVPASPAYTNPLDIKGVTRPYYTLVKVWADTLLPCEKSMYVKSRVVFLGPGKSGSRDRVELFLPKGMTRDSSYYNAIRNAPNKDSVRLSNINGATLLSWVLPKNIVPGDSLEFDIRVNGNGPALNCGTSDILIRSVVIQPVVCVTTGSACDIKVITGSELATPLVDKGSLEIIPGTIFSKLLSSDTEEVKFNYVVLNKGKYMNGSDAVKVLYYYDANNNGKRDAADKYLGRDSLNQILKTGQALSVSRTLRVKAGYSCGLLAVIDSAACSCKFAQRRLNVPQLQNAGNDTAVCSGSGLKLGTYPVKSFYYFWDNYQVLDDRLLGNPTYILKNAGPAADTTTLVLTTNRGLCISKDTVQVILNPLPEISVLPSDTQVCQNQLFKVSGVSWNGTGSRTYQWKPSAGVQNASSINTGIRPPANTLYTVFVTDAKGCSGMDTLRVKVFPYPVSGFSWPVTCAGNDPLLTDTSHISSGSITSTEWKYGTTDTFNARKITLPMGGQSKVSVTMINTSDIGCTDTITRWVDVKSNPVAAFSVPYVCFGDSSRFLNSTFLDSGTLSAVDWDFGDNQSGSGKNISHLYPSAKDYPVLLTVRNNWGCKDTVSGKARIFPVPKALFSVSDICQKDSLRFGNNSKLYGDTLQTWDWNFGVLGTSASMNPVVLAPNYAAISASLRVTTLHGCRDSARKTVNVYPLPLANFGSTTVCLDNQTQFSDSSKIPAGNIASWYYDLGDGFASMQASPQWKYKSPGVYSVALRIVSDKGCADSVRKQVTVHPQARPVFTVPPHCIGEPVTFTAVSWGGGNPASVKWHLGNGDSSALSSFSYTYKIVGVYPVKLSIVTDKGCYRDTTGMVEVNQLPVITLSGLNPCNDDSAIFNASASVSKGFIASSNWLFPGGVSVSQRRYAGRFSPPGTVTGRFYATTDKNCRDSAKLGIAVYQRVKPDFTAPGVCLDEPMQFTDQSTAYEKITKYAWLFGDGKNSSSQNPLYTYKKDGSWPVTLTITTLPGCDYTITQPVVVNPKPVPAFILFPNNGTIVNPNITFTDLSSGADTMWYRATDGFSTNQRNFVHAFPDSGTFQIWQYTYNRFGCADSVSEKIVIHFMYTLYVPEVFTPNRDGKNEAFGPQGMGIAWYDMKIYNRWGGLVYATDNGQPWDGTYMGEIVSNGVYSVLISLRDYKWKPHYYRGTVQVVR